MSKFVIECPRCGKYAEARTGFFARKRIDCACGNVIHVRTDKISARQCPRCGNTVVFDQSKGDKAACPVCGTAINTLDQQSKFVEFSCAQCGVGLSAPKNEQTHVCPVCDYENNVRERLIAEQIRKEGRASVIKFEGDNESLVWKHPVEDFNFGSQLIVNESQEALFFRDGTAVGPLGPGRYTLETQHVPALEKLSRAAYDGSVTLHSQVYFINKNVQMAIRWGTPEKVRFLDPLTETPLQIGASGEMNVRVQDSRKLLLKLVGTMKGISWQDGAGMASSLQHAFRPMITAAVKSNLPAAIKDNNIDLLEVDEHLELISQRLLEKLRPGFEDYGLTIPQFYVTGVVLPEEDPNFKRIRDLHTIVLQNRIIQADADVRTAQANAKAQYRSAEEQSNAVIEAARRDAVLQSQITETELARQQAARQIILAQAEAQAAKLKGMTEAEIMAAKGYSERDLIQAEVQKSYAGALGQMGSGGVAGNILGMNAGLAAAQNLAPQVGSFVQGFQMGGVPAAGPGPVGVPYPGPGQTWTCPTCGKTGLDSLFCPGCGTKKPEAPAGWTCPTCGRAGLSTAFCPGCGTKKQEAPATWTCPTCGRTGLDSLFCPACGTKRR